MSNTIAQRDHRPVNTKSKKRRPENEIEDEETVIQKQPKPSFFECKSIMRKQSMYSKNIRVSNQSCKEKNNKVAILSCINSTKNHNLKQRLSGILTVLETLFLPSTYNIEQDIDVTEAGFAESDHKCGGIIEFNEAFDLYIDHIDNSKMESACKPREDILKSQFLLDILNDKYGLRCLVMTISAGENRFILLDNDNIDLPSIIDQIIEQSSSYFERMQNVDYKFIRDCLASMDSEYDKSM